MGKGQCTWNYQRRSDHFWSRTSSQSPRASWPLPKAKEWSRDPRWPTEWTASWTWSSSMTCSIAVIPISGSHTAFSCACNSKTAWAAWTGCRRVPFLLSPLHINLIASLGWELIQPMWSSSTWRSADDLWTTAHSDWHQSNKMGFRYQIEGCLLTCMWCCCPCNAPNNTSSLSLRFKATIMCCFWSLHWCFIHTTKSDCPMACRLTGCQSHEPSLFWGRMSAWLVLMLK